MKKFKVFFFGTFCAIFFFSNIIAIENKILFKVNNEIITSLDILTKLRYLELIINDFKKNLNIIISWLLLQLLEFLRLNYYFF